jgi:hypothetical protein
MPKYWMIGSGVALGVLLIAAIAVALMRDAVVLPEGSPERAVQLYLQAISEEDFEAAQATLSSELKERCSLEALYARSYARENLDNSRVAHNTTNLVDDKAIVVFEVTQVSQGGPFDLNEWSHDEHYTLVREEGEWRISASPWPYQGCTQPRIPIVKPTIVPAPKTVPATTTDTAR